MVTTKEQKLALRKVRVQKEIDIEKIKTKAATENKKIKTKDWRKHKADKKFHIRHTPHSKLTKSQVKAVKKTKTKKK
tara:strand:- start:368 stop:598 length:231 start_codon:yes stop_codon:yes gene_type:complete